MHSCNTIRMPEDRREHTRLLIHAWFVRIASEMGTSRGKAGSAQQHTLFLDELENLIGTPARTPGGWLLLGKWARADAAFQGTRQVGFGLTSDLSELGLRQLRQMTIVTHQDPRYMTMQCQVPTLCRCAASETAMFHPMRNP